jgi:hypothetical protein
VNLDVSESWFKQNGFADPAGADPRPGAVSSTQAKTSGAVDEQPLNEPVGRPPSQATMLVELAGDAELFHTAGHEAFAVVAVHGHRELWPVRARAFRHWLQRLHFEETGKAARAQAVQDALGVLEGRALFDGAEQSVEVRLADREGAVYLDLADDEWRAIEVTTSGWAVVSDPPVWFRRPGGMLSLPMPERGGELDELRRFVNIADDDWPLLAAFVIASLRPFGPYPVLALHGEQGAAKSTTARVIRALIDPNRAALRAEPRNPHELAIAAQNGWLIVVDNLSHLPPWLSDGFCRLATGGGFAARELYTDADEVLFDAQRPVVLTGIGELATRGDLLDRALMLTLPCIDDEHRQDEESFWQEFEEAQPRLLGVLLDAFSEALRRLPDVQLARPPRMADFARLAVAAEPALGLPTGSFLAAYAGKRAEAHELALDGSPLAEPVRAVAAAGFIGTATELLARLADQVSEEVVRRKSWPANATRLSHELRRLAPNLRAVGIELEFGFKLPGSRRGIAVRGTASEDSVPSVPTVQVADSSPPPEEAATTSELVLDARDATDAESQDHSLHDSTGLTQTPAYEQLVLAETDFLVAEGVLTEPAVKREGAP